MTTTQSAAPQVVTDPMDEIERLQGELATVTLRAQQQAHGLLRRIEDQNKRIAEVQAEVLARRREADSANYKLELATAEVEQTRAELTQAREQLDAMRSDLSQTKDYLNKVATQLDAVSRSTSWRLTAPLRSVSGVFRKSGN